MASWADRRRHRTRVRVRARVDVVLRLATGLFLNGQDTSRTLSVVAGLLAHAVHWGVPAAGFGAAPATTAASLAASLVVLPKTHRFHLPFAGVGFAATVSMLPGIFIFPMSSALVLIAERGAGADPALVTGALGDGITALLVVLGMTLGLVAPKLAHDVWRRRSARRDTFRTVTGVLDA